MARGRIILHEHKNLATNGRVKRLELSEYSENTLHSLRAIDFKDCLSSVNYYRLKVGSLKGRMEFD